MNHIPKKILIFRLSSLGDVILATSALSGNLGPGREVHWVVLKEFAGLLSEHPMVKQVWVYDRKSGFLGWVKLCIAIKKEGFQEIWDLHLSLRTRLARLLLWRGIRWRVISKERIKRWGYHCLKRFWPAVLRPVPYYQKCATFAGNPSGKPNLKHLLLESKPKENYPPYYCVMPSSRWKGKEWPVELFVRLIQKLDPQVFGVPMILGTEKDRACLKLVSDLRARGINCTPMLTTKLEIERGSFKEIAGYLAFARFYLGVDTGLAHLAEAVGTPSKVILGPTIQDGGFGVWSKESISVGSQIGCRPCSKDGRWCFRIKRRFACLNELSTEEVFATLFRGINES